MVHNPASLVDSKTYIHYLVCPMHKPKTRLTFHNAFVKWPWVLIISPQSLIVTYFMFDTSSSIISLWFVFHRHETHCTTKWIFSTYPNNLKQIYNKRKLHWLTTLRTLLTRYGELQINTLTTQTTKKQVSSQFLKGICLDCVSL